MWARYEQAIEPINQFLTLISDDLVQVYLKAPEVQGDAFFVENLRSIKPEPGYPRTRTKRLMAAAFALTRFIPVRCMGPGPGLIPPNFQPRLGAIFTKLPQIRKRDFSA